MAAVKTTNRRSKCRLCGTEQSIMPNDTLADHTVGKEKPRRCFGSGMGPAVSP